MKDYLIKIFYSNEDKCYIADIPELKYCSAHGPTPEEALKEILIAKELWLEAARDLGKPVPPPIDRFPARSRRQKPQRAGR